jgi:hypothetical protein
MSYSNMCICTHFSRHVIGGSNRKPKILLLLLLQTSKSLPSIFKLIGCPNHRAKLRFYQIFTKRDKSCASCSIRSRECDINRARVQGRRASFSRAERMDARFPGAESTTNRKKGVNSKRVSMRIVCRTEAFSWQRFVSDRNLLASPSAIYRFPDRHNTATTVE